MSDPHLKHDNGTGVVTGRLLEFWDQVMISEILPSVVSVAIFKHNNLGRDLCPKSFEILLF